MAEKYFGPGSKHRGILRVEVSEQSMKGMQRLANYVDTLPNRIETAKVRAINSAARKMKTYLKNRYGNIGLALEVNAIIKNGAVGFKGAGRFARLEIKPGKVVKQSKSDHGYNNVWGARLAFYGRKSFTLPLRMEGSRVRYYELRPGSAARYADYLAGPITIPSMKPNYAMKKDINDKAKQTLINDFRAALIAVGFGPRGGGSRMKDLPHVDTRSVAPHQGGIQVRRGGGAIS